MPSPSKRDLDHYADLALQIGLDLQPGQPLVIRSPLEAAPLVRSVAERAYRMGSGIVSVIYADSEVGRARLRHGADAALDDYPHWHAHALNEAATEGAAVLTVLAEDPDVYAEEDAVRVARAQTAARQRLAPFYQGIGRTALNWCLVGYPSPAWAAKVYPDDSEADVKLWNAMRRAVRLDREDPVAAWRAHIGALKARADHLNGRAFRALRFVGSGTDLRVGLADGHVWAGPTAVAPSGAAFIANMPTEEVFTAPHRQHVDGMVRATRPLSHAGKVIDGFWLRFADGAVVEAGARQGEDVLHEILETDAGARRLGEVALVEASNPVARAGVLYYETLYDENAASHFALGRAYAFTVRDGANLDAPSLAERGVNDSLSHVDFMIGSPDVDVDGEHEDGRREPIMRRGAFVI